jgi:sugar phosphate isomerase/epimerase
MAAPLALQAQSSPTKFQIACMTLPYGAFPFRAALEGIKGAGYKYVAWGTSHRPAEGGKPVPILALDAPAKAAADLSRQCRDVGLEPVMMFSSVALESPNGIEQYSRRIEHAAAAGIPFMLAFGRTQPGQYEIAIKNLKGIADTARKSKVTIVIKQHGGNTATGADCSKIIKEVGEDSVRMCYDAGNVLDYENHDPIPDIQSCWQDVRAFALKDHRNWPQDQDCAPGYGEIDHYRLLHPVMRTGLTMPLAFENIFQPLVPRPSTIEGVNALAQRAREFIETVLSGLERGPQGSR